MKKKAFTLIELLVVVAIIGILAAVGVTTFGGFQEKAKINKVKSDHATVVKFISLGVTKCGAGLEFKLKHASSASTYSEIDRCNLVNSGNGSELVTRISHHFLVEVYFNKWCRIDGDVSVGGYGQKVCEEAVVSGGGYGLIGDVYVTEIHSCDNANISDCRTLVIETRYNDNEFLTNTIKF